MFAVEMDLGPVRHNLWWSEDKGAALRLVLPAGESATEAVLFRDGKAVTVGRSGEKSEYVWFPGGAPYDRGLALQMVFPPAGLLADRSITWTSETGPGSDLVTMIGRGDALEARLVIKADTLFPVEFVAQSGGSSLAGRFEFVRLVDRSSATDRLFEEKRLKSWFE